MDEHKEDHNKEAYKAVKCDECMKEVPSSEAKSVEASDYVAHFCGLECYDKWRRRAKAKG